MANTHQYGRRKEIRQRSIPPDTIITTDTYGLLLTESSLLDIANKISALVGHKLTTGDVDQLAKYCSRLRESEYYRLNYRDAQQKIARDFLNRYHLTLREENDDYLISGVSDDTDRGTISDYSRKELAQFTPDENQYKFIAFADRRGNAVIDEERVAGDRGSPNNILPISQQISQDDTNRAVYETSKIIKSFMAPESTERMFNRIQTSSTNYYSINLPHQLIQFDSRNRLPTTTNAPNNYRWNLHTAGYPGQIGDVRIQDTLQQLIQMKLFPFWAPINQSTLNIYRKIRMLITEYAAQSVVLSEFNDPTQSVPTVEHYHFELEVQQIQGDRMYLVPRENVFRFRKPMAKNIDTFTVHFRTPFLNEVFDADSGVFTISYANPTLFTINSPATFNLNTGDLVYVYNSNSGNAAIDALINNPAGQIITKLSNTQFTIPVDSSSLVGTESNINVYFGSKRLFFQIEFTSLEQ